MALYRVRFLDHREEVYATHHVEHDDDEAAIAAAHRLNVVSHVGVAVEVWDDERLVRRLPTEAAADRFRGPAGCDRARFASAYTAPLWAAVAVTAADYITSAFVPRLASLVDIVTAAILVLLGIVVWIRTRAEGKLGFIDFIAIVLLILFPPPLLRI